MIPPSNLWSAEWRKTVTRPFYQVLFLMMLALVLAFFLVMGIGAAVFPERMRPMAQALLPFPQCLTSIAQIAVIVGQLLAAVFVAQSVGSEYSLDTWKMIVPRAGTRLTFLLLKIGIALLGMLLVLLSMHGLGILLSAIASAALHLESARPAEPSNLALLRGVLVLLLPMLLYGSVALLTTVATRSSMAGALLSFFGLQTMALLAPAAGPVALVLPYPHLPNVVERWALHDMATLQRIDQDFGMHVSPWLSIGVVLAYCGLALLGAGRIFWQRDMHGE